MSNPYPGLRPFREDEEHLFFGRENQVDAMVDKLAKSRFLAVVGTSGSGKSSLVNCGLKPALRLGLMPAAGTSWRMVQCRPGNRPIRALARALASKDGPFGDFRPEGLELDEIVDATLRMSRVGIADVYEQAGQRLNLLVVVDQFEELFRYRSTAAAIGISEQQRAEEAAAFVNLLLQARAQSEYPIYVVLTMRSDFLGDCAQFGGLPEAINESQYLVPRMTREERRAAIAGPAGVGGAQISPVLLTRLVNDVGDNPDQLSILQHALNRTWARWQGQGKGEGALELTHYEAIGAMAHALDQHAEKAFGELTERQKEICRQLFKALTDKGTDARGTRRPASLATLSAVTGAGHDELVAVIDVFRKPSRSFLMPPQPEVLEADRVIDISHETLMRVWERLRAWADEEADSARLYRRLSDTAALHKQGQAGLWRDPELQFALDWRERQKPSATWADMYGGGFAGAMEFLDASEAQRAAEAKQAQEDLVRQQALVQKLMLADEQKLRLQMQSRMVKRLRLLLAALGIVCIAALGLAVFAWREQESAVYHANHALAQTKLADQQRRAAEYEREAAVAARKKLEASLNVLSNFGAEKIEAAVDKTTAAALLPRVYMQIVNEADRDRANEISLQLRQAGMLVLGVEFVPTAAGLKVSEARYYKKAEEITASKIVAVLKATGYPDAKASYLERFENSTKVRPNHFEVWLAHKAEP